MASRSAVHLRSTPAQGAAQRNAQRLRVAAGLARFVMLMLVAASLVCVAPGSTGAQPADGQMQTFATVSVQDIARIAGQGRSELRGIGIVVGLSGTGDPGSELLLARPLARVYEANGNPMPDLESLARARAAAIVWVDCQIPEQGARANDTFDVNVSVMHSATSLEGGRLILSPLSGPMPGQGVYAMASGPIVVEDSAWPTVGRIRGGATLIQDIAMPTVRGSFSLVVDPHYRGWTTTERLAAAINANFSNLDDEEIIMLARAIDEMTVRVEIPTYQRSDSAAFISRVLTTDFSPALLDLPAQVIINERTGSIIVTGNVEISPVAVAHKDLVVTTTLPEPVPTAEEPLVHRENWIGLHTGGRASERARLEDLLQVFKRLDLPIADQIHILNQMHRAGRLHARLIIE